MKIRLCDDCQSEIKTKEFYCLELVKMLNRPEKNDVRSRSTLFVVNQGKEIQTLELCKSCLRKRRFRV